MRAEAVRSRLQRSRTDDVRLQCDGIAAEADAKRIKEGGSAARVPRAKRKTNDLEAGALLEWRLLERLPTADRHEKSFPRVGELLLMLLLLLQVLLWLLGVELSHLRGHCCLLLQLRLLLGLSLLLLLILRLQLLLLLLSLQCLLSLLFLQCHLLSLFCPFPCCRRSRSRSRFPLQNDFLERSEVPR